MISRGVLYILYTQQHQEKLTKAVYRAKAVEEITCRHRVEAYHENSSTNRDERHDNYLTSIERAINMTF